MGSEIEGSARAGVVRSTLARTAVAAAAMALIGAGCGGSSSKSGNPTTTTASSKGASDAIALLAKGKQGTWHAKYTLSAGGGASGATTLLEVWLRSSNERQDTEQTVGTTVVSHSEAFVLAKSTITCGQQAGTGPWLCTSSPSANSGGILSSAGAQLKGLSVTESTDTLQGRPVRCFQATISGQPTKLCLTADGIPALYVTGVAQLQLQSLDHSVPNSVFTPPAAVKSGKS